MRLAHRASEESLVSGILSPAIEVEAFLQTPTPG